jgi:hypothetical protein
MFKDEQLRRMVEGRRLQQSDRTVRLGHAVEQLMTKQIVPQQSKYGPVAEVWKQLLPEGLGEHCEIIDISGGRLKVKVDSPSYRYELQLCSTELLEELQQQCPKSRLSQIKFVIA